MILTNDGELANRLAHPRYGVEKMYRALVAGLPDAEMLSKLTEGVWLSDGKVRAKRARIAGRQGQATMLELVLAEGKKREIRRMLSKLGHKVMSLNRVAVGPITLKGLPVGECRPSDAPRGRAAPQGRRRNPGVGPRIRRWRAVSPAPPGRATRRPASSSCSAGGTIPFSSSGQGPARARRSGHSRDEDAGKTRPPRRPAAARGPSPHGDSRPARRQDRHPSASGTPGGPPTQGPRGLAVGDSTEHRSTTRPPDQPTRTPPGVKQPPDKPKRPTSKTPPPIKRAGSIPAEETPHRRRIIGMEEPKPSPSAGRSLPRPPGRKRPTSRKPRPPRRPLAPRSGRLGSEQNTNDDEL